MRPEPIPLTDKLYGNLEELRRTATFVMAKGISATKKENPSFLVRIFHDRVTQSLNPFSPM